MARPRKMTTGLLALVAAAMLVVSSCGDDDDDTSGGGAASGEPVKILQWTSIDNPNFDAPDARAGAQARVQAINEAGGIDGRPLELEFCNTMFDPNREAACARQAVEGGFAAVVGSYAFFPNTLPLLERAGIAFIGGQGLTPAELTSKVSFPIASGIPGWFQGATALALERGAQRVAIVSSPIAATEFAARLMTQALERVGKPAVHNVVAPLGQPDQSAAATEAADGTDAVVLGSAPSDTIKVVQALRQSNYSGRIASVSSQFSADTIGTLGAGTAEGILLTSQMAPVSQTDNPAIAEFIENMDAVAPSEVKSERAVTAWAAVDLFAKLVDRMEGDISAATVLDAMTNLSDPIDVGVTAPYRTTGEPAVPDFPRIFNPTIWFTEIKGGAVVAEGDGPVNPFQLLADMSNN